MWIKKNHKELFEESTLNPEFIKASKKKRFRQSVRLFIFTFFFTFIISIIVGLTIGDPFDRFSQVRYAPVDLSELPEYLLGYFLQALFLAVGIFILSYYVLLKYKSASTVMCDKCYNVKNPDNISTCKCGGFFLKISDFKWIEDEK
jgi:ABC-type dipeptide/oligopeptide/nickel transport system permease component